MTRWPSLNGLTSRLPTSRNSMRKRTDTARPVWEAGLTEMLVAVWIKNLDPEGLEGLRAKVFRRVVGAMRGRRLYGRALAIHDGQLQSVSAWAWPAPLLPPPIVHQDGSDLQDAPLDSLQVCPQGVGKSWLQVLDECD